MIFLLIEYYWELIGNKYQGLCGYIIDASEGLKR